MHELGLVFALSDLLEEVAAEQDLSRICRVTVELGEVSGVVAEQLQDAWGWAAQKSDLLRGCQLELKTVPAVTVCNSCGRTYPTVPQGRICPHCGSSDTQLLRGNEFEVTEVEGM
ncbi:hydrogenase maturation nickel metallochaperone HypA [Parvibacter caecicola]|uniref:hydrogenase maturation nickel metallochaperone HypA n=1 Tax=Parvibacter caecicola TaxID=747645 RepID=UPI00249ADFFA|nr:hydrogenase maturation nickel metallochaperone HypA [Parvibacter caecicola]